MWQNLTKFTNRNSAKKHPRHHPCDCPAPNSLRNHDDFLRPKADPLVWSQTSFASRVPHHAMPSFPWSNVAIQAIQAIQAMLMSCLIVCTVWARHQLSVPQNCSMWRRRNCETCTGKVTVGLVFPFFHGRLWIFWTQALLSARLAFALSITRKPSFQVIPPRQQSTNWWKKTRNEAAESLISPCQNESCLVKVHPAPPIAALLGCSVVQFARDNGHRSVWDAQALVELLQILYGRQQF